MRPELTRDAIEHDVTRRLHAVNALMAEFDLGAIVALATGAPSQAGWLHYLAAAELYDGAAFVVLDPGRRDPLIVVSPEDAAEAIQATAATRRVEALASTDRAIQRVIEIIGSLVGSRGRVGVLGAGSQWSWRDHVEVTRTLPGLTLVDITPAANALRMIKSPVEVAIMQEMGRLLDQGLTLFEQEARPGRLAWEVAGEIEGFLRGRGCFWGTSKYSFDHRPYLYPAPLDRRLRADDAMVYEFVYSGPPGYWYILSSLYSFRPLADGVARRLRATEQAIRETARVAVPGNTRADLARAADRVFTDWGMTIVGRHTVDCHPIGTDINDGPGDVPPEWTLRENMTLAIHPATLLEGECGYFLCDVFLVRPEGAVALSPRRSFYRHLDGATGSP